MGVALRCLMLLIQACKILTESETRGRDADVRIRRFVKVLVIEIFSSVLGLFGLIIGLLVSGKALGFE